MGNYLKFWLSKIHDLKWEIMIFKNKFPPDHLFYCSPLDPKKLEMISGRLEVPIWLLLNVQWWWTREEQERAQKGKKRTNFAQTISGWTVGCFPKVANPQSEPACAQRISQIWTIFDKNVSVWPGPSLCPQYWRIPGASYEKIFEMLPTIVTFIWLDFAVCFCRWSDSHNRGVFIREDLQIIIIKDYNPKKLTIFTHHHHHRSNNLPFLLLN